MTKSRSEARARIIEAMREDPFMDDIRALGTTAQDQRMAHYADIAIAAFTGPAAAMPEVLSREAIARALFQRFKERSAARVVQGSYANDAWENLPVSFSRDFLLDADAILALIPSHSGETGELELLREALESGLRALDSDSTPIIRRLARIQIRTVLKGEGGQS